MSRRKKTGAPPDPPPPPGTWQDAVPMGVTQMKYDPSLGLLGQLPVIQFTLAEISTWRGRP